MIFRRNRHPDQSSDETTNQATVSGVRSQGPYDVDEVTLPEDDTRLDLGSLLLRGLEGYELQLPVEEASGQVVAVVYAGPESALEVRAFAAPRNGDLWPEVRREIAAEVTRQGGTATESDGPFGPELRVNVAMTTPEGQRVQQASRIVGVSGPRWLLRATLFGRAMGEPGADADLLGALRDLIVVRGTHPAPPGDALPLRLPPEVTVQQQD